MNVDIKKLTIEKAHDHLMSGDISSMDLVEAYKKSIEEKNKDVNAFLEVFDDVEAQAKRADEMIKKGEATLLTGIPISLKDNILIEGKIASASSKILENYKATYDSSVVKKLKEHGAVILGRTNMDEFAMGSSTENSAFGRTKNPYDLTRVPGGSSGGAAASVAMDGVLCALGSDTGGSIRQPASFCGVVGLLPTYGTVSRSGLMAMGSSLDQIGPLTKTVRDAEILFKEISFHDSMDSTSVPDNMRAPKKTTGKKRIGVLRDMVNGEGIDKVVKENFDESLKKLESLGYEIVDITVPLLEHSLPIYYILMPAEASTNLSRFDSVRYGYMKEGKDGIDTYRQTRGGGFGKEVRRRILLGTYILSHGYYDAYYNKSIALRAQLIENFNTAFEDIDVIVTPTTPTPAFLAGEKSKDPLSMYLSDIFTVSANIAGIPALSVPSGVTEDGLPLGIQFMGRHFDEETLFEIGKKFEQV